MKIVDVEDFTFESFKGLQSWDEGGRRSTIIYTDRAMILLDGDSFSGCADFDPAVLGSRDLSAFRGPMDALAEGML